MRLRLPILLGILLMACGGAAWAARSDVPSSFELTNWTQPGQPQPTGDSTCTSSVSGSPPSGTKTCTTNFAGSDDYDATGNVSTTDGKLSGTASGHCSTTVTATRINTYPITNGAMGQPSLSGSRDQSENCTVHFKFSDGSTLDLTANHDESGPYAVRLTQSSALADGTTHGTITYGSGVYRGYVGTLNQSAYRALLDNSRQWQARLHKGATLTAIGYPIAGAKITKTSDPGLRVLSAPGLACSATATSGATTIKLGTKTSAADGSALIVPKLTAVLKPGTWTISATCGKASAKGTYTVSN